MLAVGGACGAALVIVAVLASYVANPVPPPSTGWASGSTVSVVDFELTPTYIGDARNDTNYLSQADCTCEPINLPPGGSFSWWVRFANTDTVNHTLLRLTVDPPLRLVGALPAPPYLLPGGGVVNVSMLLQVPTIGGDYEFTGGIWVT